MQEMELISSIAKESITLLVVVVLVFLLVKPKDKQLQDSWISMQEKDKQMEVLLDVNKELAEQTKLINDGIRTVVNNQSNHIASVVQDVGRISETMDKISTELQSLSKTQTELKDGQNDLWKEIILLKVDKKE